MSQDPIADFLTRIRNALQAKHRYVDDRMTKMKLTMAKILEEQGFVKGVVINQELNMLRIYLKYDSSRQSVVRQLRRISKPGLRRYIGYQEIPRVLGGMGLAILSTNQGVMDGEKARENKLGGEILCTIW